MEHQPFRGHQGVDDEDAVEVTPNPNMTFHQGETLNEESKEVDLHQITFDQKGAGSPTNQVSPSAAEMPTVVAPPKAEAKPKEPEKPVQVSKEKTK